MSARRHPMTAHVFTAERIIDALGNGPTAVPGNRVIDPEFGGVRTRGLAGRRPVSVLR